ncbi:ATP-binding protein [Ruminococcus flavefaciens]|uniref:AAA family ATPase n=1 Tax=Ruminococcus flavefaciens TaxID=1265 RepID=UPI00056181E5|nr:AAA family ATPase [Ruminococcus flavefaciens]
MKELKITSELIYMDTIRATETKWLWYPYIPFGKITVIQGDPGEGKTTLILNIAARLTQGILPQSQEKCEPMNVIYQTAEDGLSDTVKPRLLSAGADCSRIIVINESERNVTMSDKRLEAAIAHTHAKLVILDPLQAYIGSEVDMHRANEIRPVMSHLASIAEKYGCSVVLIGHMNKAMGMKSTYRGLGSIDITAAARSVLIVARDKENPNFRVVAHTKSSLAPEGKTVAFELDPDSGFHFKGEYDCNIDEILLGVGSMSKGRQAMELLQEELKDGEVSQKVISAKAKYSRISSRTLNEAKKILGVKSVKRNGQWFWALPKNENE